MTSPPYLTERLLGALGAQPGFRDDVLGDLAEEFVRRAVHEGASGARRWYRREAVYAVPYLLRDWARRLSARDIGYVVATVLTSYACVLLVARLVFTLRAFGTKAMLSVSLADLARRLPALWAGTIALVLAMTGAMIGGYIAASLGVRAPLASAAALGVAWSGFLVAARGLGGPAFARYGVAFTAVAAVLIVVGTTVGGVSRIGRAARESTGGQFDESGRW